jgi:aryl-alcohol dehydrogenase-like predicted oxidoreductase
VRTHRLGSTGLTVSAIGLGLAALGRPGYINLGRDRDLGRDRSIARMEQRCHQLLDAGYAAGVKYVDAARSYGLAETFLASWLSARRLAPIDVTIGSKWGYVYTGEWRIDAPVHEVKDLSLTTLQRQIAESRSLLGQHLQLYQIHSATVESGVLEKADLLRELSRLRSSGLAIGLTVSGPKQADVIRRALEVRVDGVNPFQVVQATWNLLETSAGAALSEAKSQGWGVIVKEVLANGRLTEGNADLSSRADLQVRLDTTELRRRAKALGTTVDVVAMAAALAQPWVDVVLSGAVTTDQLRRNISALEFLSAVGDLPSVAEPPGQYWKNRSVLKWA